MTLDFVTTGYILSGFLFVLAVLQLWVALQLKEVGEERGRVSLRRMFSIRNFLFLFGAFYLFLCFLFLYVTVGSSLFLTYQAPCEQLLTNTTIVGNSTLYTYTNSCAALTPPRSIERLYVILSYVLMLQMIMAVIAMLVAIMRWMLKW